MGFWHRKEPHDSSYCLGTLTRAKLKGGLGLTQSSNQALTLKVRGLNKLFDGEETQWVTMSQSLINKAVWKGRWSKESRSSSAQEFLLLAHTTLVQSKTLQGLLIGWQGLVEVATLEEGETPTDLSIFKLFPLALGNGEWKTLHELRGSFSSHRVGKIKIRELLDYVQEFSVCKGVTIGECKGWT